MRDLLFEKEVLDAHPDVISPCKKDDRYKSAHSHMSLRSHTHFRLRHNRVLFNMARLSYVGTLRTATPSPPTPPPSPQAISQLETHPNLYATLDVFH